MLKLLTHEDNLKMIVSTFSIFFKSPFYLAEVME